MGNQLSYRETLMSSSLIDILILIFIYVNSCFILAWIKKDNSIMDIAWGLGFVGIAVWMEVFYPLEMRWLITLFVTVYGLRLALFLYYRNKGKPEDWRYANWRKDWGKYALLRSYFQVFILQGFFLFIISLSIQTPHFPPYNLDLKIYLGALIFLTGFTFESVSDYQLLQFKRSNPPKSEILRSGLWKYSRHPNYFGEILIWWGLFLISSAYGRWYIAILSPITISWLLIRVSGVPMLEEKYKNNPAYQEYIRTTNALIPNIRTFALHLLKLVGVRLKDEKTK